MRKILPVYIILLLPYVLNIQNTFAQTQSDTSLRKIYIVRHDWHTGIIFNKKEAIPHLTKLNKEFINVKFLEMSWGDKDFFTSDKGTIWQALKAIFVPTKSVLLVSAYDKNPYLYFNLKNIQELSLSHDNFTHLISYLNSSLAIHSDSQQPIVVLKYSEMSCFYLSNEKYHAFKTCNVWTARALKKSGLKVIPAWAITSRNIMRQVRRIEKHTITTVNKD
ncbi:hypothetical protein ES705_20582 [subsurface metagenome]